MALPTIIINGSTGSDTLCSGAGLTPTTAVNGSNATTASSTTVTISDSVSLSGVATDGSALLWVNTASGRQSSNITAISGSSGSWTLTVSVAYTVSSSGLSWAIGGSRASLQNSLQLGKDWRSGWIGDIQSDQTLTSTFNITPNLVGNQWAIFYSSLSTKPTITTSTNSVSPCDLQGANNLLISNLHLKSTAGTPADGIAPASFNSAANNIIVENCLIEGFRNGIADHDNGQNVNVLNMIVSGCEIKTCTAAGIATWTYTPISYCYIHACPNAINASGGHAGGTLISRCVLDSNTSSALLINAPGNTLIEHCDFSNNIGSAGTQYGIVDNGGTAQTMVIRNSIFWNNKTYGLGGTLSALESLFMTNNAFGGNGTGNAQSPFTTGNNPVILTVNPFTSSSDFSLNNTSGGGLLCKGAGAIIPGASSNTIDIGAIQSAGGTTISGIKIPIPMLGGING